MPIKNITAHSSSINRLKVIPKNRLASASGDHTVTIWDISGWNLIIKYTGHAASIWGLEYIEDDIMASCSFDFTIQIWSISNGYQIKNISVGNQASALQLLPDGHLACAVYETSVHISSIKIFNFTTGELVSELLGLSEQVFNLLLIKNQLLASTGCNKNILIWNITDYSLLFDLNGHGDCVFGLSLISLNFLASSSKDATIKIWNLESGALHMTLASHTGRIYYGIDLFDESTLISGSYDQSVKFWNVSTGQVVDTLNTGFQSRSLVVLDNCKSLFLGIIEFPRLCIVSNLK